MSAFMILVCLGVAAVGTSGACPWLISALDRRGVIDTVSSRSSHVGQVPRGGGLAVLVGFAAALTLTLDEWAESREMVVLLTCAAGFTLLGLADDLQSLPVRFRLTVQTVLAAFAVSLLPVESIPLVGPVPIVGGTLAAMWVVGFVNAFNFMDGINGISSASTIVLRGSLAVSAVRWDVEHVAIPALSVVGASLGFLPFNALQARVFLGDVGSYLLGSVLSLIAVIELGSGVPPIAVLLPFSVYVGDVAFTLYRRATNHRPIFKSHREHSYQLLANGGWGHLRTSGLVGLLTLVLAGLAQLGAAGTVAGLFASAAGGAVVISYLRLPDYP